MILILGAIVAGYLYLAALCWRLGHPSKHGKQLWSAPRPTRLFHQGSHAKPRARHVETSDKVAPTELVVAG